MFGRNKLKDEIVRLTYRVEELEERLCPCGDHDWKKVDYRLVSFTNGYDTDAIFTYKCKRCGKVVERMN